MRPLQDKCDPTPYDDLKGLFLSDMGVPISELFDNFDPEPIGVASLAQVHVGRHCESGKQVAVKVSSTLLFPDLTGIHCTVASTSTPCGILRHRYGDGRSHPGLVAINCSLSFKQFTFIACAGWIKYWFPEFEFRWLGEEMRENLPKEMDFAHEASNAQRAAYDFRDIRTSLYIPEVITATKRVLVMEYIKGGRVDDLAYLAEHNIDRNKVALELSRIFNQMVFVNGWFHAGRFVYMQSEEHIN
jgi:aarF domain-containing kinase